MALFAILGLLLVAAIFLPQIWVKRVMAQYHGREFQYNINGAELARTLLDRYGLQAVAVERTKEGDHYDPNDRTVRLTAENHDGFSLTALTIAAHEVGHAIQHDTNYKPMAVRTKMVGRMQGAERIGAMIMMAAPVFAILLRRPLPTFLLFFAGLASLGMPVLMHLATLPVEMDASFNRALPILKAGNHIKPEHEAAAHKLLRAAAFTYVAGSLNSMLNFWKWLRMLRR